MAREIARPPGVSAQHRTRRRLYARRSRRNAGADGMTNILSTTPDGAFDIGGGTMMPDAAVLRDGRVAADSFWCDAQFEAECERSEEHTSELQSLMRISYAVFCLKKKNKPDATKSTRL